MHSLNLTSNYQWMVVGVTGRHGNHAVWRVERETGHVLANALIQRQNGMERIALGPIPTLRAAICPSVKVDVFFWTFFFFLKLFRLILMLLYLHCFSFRSWESYWLLVYFIAVLLWPWKRIFVGTPSCKMAKWHTAAKGQTSDKDKWKAVHWRTSRQISSVNHEQ